MVSSLNLVELSIIREITGKKRFKRYLFSNFVDIIAEGTKMDGI
jgi:hypothetical protein